MCCSDRSRHILPTLALLLACGVASAEHVVSIGLEADTEESKAISLLGSFAVASDSWLTASVSRSRSEDRLFDLETLFADLGFDHHFDPLGLRVGVGYWGDPELLESNDARAALYFRNDRFSLSLDYERRAFDLTVRSLLLDEPRRVEFDADGVGVSARLALNDAFSVYANGMRYDYSRNIALEPNVDVLRVFALSRLSMMNSLLDDRIGGGLEWSVGTRLIDLRVTSWRTAVFGDRVDSIGIGLLTPLGDASDLELRLETDDTDTVGRATVFSVFLYFYGN